MSKKIQMFEDIKMRYVRLAIETKKIATTAKSAGVHRNTLQRWIEEYGDQIRDEMESEGYAVDGMPIEKSADYYKQQYERAMRLLGEKELEIAVLRDLLKKSPY